MPTVDAEGRGQHGEEDERADGYAAVSTGVARGGLWSAGGQGVGLTISLVATPFTIRLLGTARYGVWSLLQTVLSWVALADLGMATTSTKFAGDARGHGDRDGEVRAIWVAAAITCSACGLAAVVTAVAAPWIVDDILRLHGSLRGPAILGLRLLCAGLIGTAVYNAFNTSQQIRLKWRSITIIAVGGSILQVVLIPAVLAALGGGVVTACAVSLGTTLLSATATFAVARRLTPGLGRPRFSGSLARTMLRFGAALTISGLATIPLTSAERLFLAHYSTPVQVAYYVVASRLALLLAAIPQAVTAPLFPALIGLESSGAGAAARRLYRDGLVGIFLLLTPAAVLLCFIAAPFLGAWAGHIYALHSTTLFFVIIAGVWFNVLSYMPETYLTATGHAAALAKVRSAEVLPYLAAAALLTAHFGAVGAAAVWSARAVIDGTIFFAVSRRRLGATVSPLSDRKARSLLAPVLLAAAALLAAPLLPGIAARAAGTLGLLALYALLSWTVVLSGGERRRIATLGARMFSPARRRRISHSRH